MHSRYQEIKGLKISEAINLLSGVLEKLKILTQDVYLYLFYAVNLLQEIIILIFGVSLFCELVYMALIFRYHMPFSV